MHRHRDALQLLTCQPADSPPSRPWPQGLFARVRRLAEPLLRLRSTKDDGTVLKAEYPLEEGILAAVGAGMQLDPACSWTWLSVL